MLLGDGIEISSFAVVSSTQLRARVNILAGAAIGNRDMIVTNLPGGGSDTLHSFLTINYPKPRIYSSSPGSIRQGETLYYYLSGSNFLPDVTKIQFGDGIKVNSVIFDSPTGMRANLFVLPGASIGARSIIVYNPPPVGGTDTLKNAFKVVESSEIETIPFTTPLAYRLYDAYPNPFNPATRIQFDVPEPSHVTLQVFNQLGMLIRTLADGYRGPGAFALNWHAGQNPSGVYIVRFRATSAISGTQVDVARKVLLLK